MSSISISQLSYVLALHRTGSFSSAAELCYITQSTLSSMIKKMEDQLGFKVFDRSSKPITLTSAGQKLIFQFKVINHELEILDEIIQETKEEMHGTLSIGIIPTLAPFLLPLFLDKLVSTYRDITFSIHEITTDEIVHRLKSRDLDIGVLSIPLQENGLNQRKLFIEDFMIYDASKSKRTSKKYKIKDIDISRLWILEESHCLTNQIGQICQLQKKRTISNNLVFNSGSILSLLELVNSNNGITLLPRLAAVNKKLIDQSRLYKIESPVPAREIGIVTHPNFAKKRILTVLEEQIIESIKPKLGKPKKLRVINPY